MNAIHYHYLPLTIYYQNALVIIEHEAVNNQCQNFSKTSDVVSAIGISIQLLQCGVGLTYEQTGAKKDNLFICFRL